MNHNLSKISFIIHKKEILYPETKFVCGISGGQDSMILMVILSHFQKVYNINNNFVYCNHFWGCKNIYNTFELLKLSYLLNNQINIFVPTFSVNSEEKGHFWRKNSFTKATNYFGNKMILLAHTLDDQIETSLWHLFRGTGPQGFNSLNKISELKIYSFFKKSITNKMELKRNYTRSATKCFQKRKRFLSKPHYFKNVILIHKDNFNSLKYPYLFQKVYKVDTLVSANLKKRVKWGKKNFLTSSLCIRYKLYSYVLIQAWFQKYEYLLTNTEYHTVKIERPLLLVSRPSIRKFVKTDRVPVVVDSSNQTLKFTRNKIRLILFPFIKFYSKLEIQTNIQKYSNISENQQKYFQKSVDLLIIFSCKKPYFSAGLVFTNIATQKLFLKIILEKYIQKQIKYIYIKKFLKTI